jgi:putative selenium metabolism protein SsnA
LLITNATLVTWEEPNRILFNYAIYIQQNQIIELGPTSELKKKYPNEVCLDANNQIVMPGNICAHTHFYGAFARGMAIPGSAPKDFPEILTKLWWLLDQSLTPDDIYLSALVMSIDAIRHGTTTLFDHHASPYFIDGSLDIIAEAIAQSGLRAVLCYEVTDRGGKEKTTQGIQENLRFIKRVFNGPVAQGQVKASFGLHASMTLSEESLETCRNTLPEDCGFHLHVAESIVDQYDSIGKTGMRVVERLKRHGILGPKTILAHAVHVDAREINILAETGTWVTHQPRSNMNNGVGVAEVESMLHAGVRLCIGTDGFLSTMWEEWKTAFLLQKAWHGDPRRLTALEVIEMGIYNNARLANTYFPNMFIGTIRPTAQADLIFVDYHPFTPLLAQNLPWHILFGFHESMITTTIVAGKVLMKDRKLITLDEQEITTRARKLVPAVWERCLNVNY